MKSGESMTKLPKISVVIATKERPKDLASLLFRLLRQSYMPSDIIIIDDSMSHSTRHVCDSFVPRFNSSSNLRYFVGSGQGLSEARNIGVKASEGEAILFLDDDILIDQNVIKGLATFLADYPSAMGVQPDIIPLKIMHERGTWSRFQNAFQKAMMMSYYARNKSKTRRSGFSVFPHPLTKITSVQRFSGCCCCYKRSLFDSLNFDINLKKYSYAEDVDFSYRANRKKPGTLYVVPTIKAIHKSSTKGRLPMKSTINMRTSYLSYLFFKNIYNSSILNFAAFLCAINGDIIENLSVLLIKRKPKREWWPFIYLVGSYVFAFKNLKSLMMGRLEFFNSSLKVK
jgi:GT2 family glycosyltransferase